MTTKTYVKTSGGKYLVQVDDENSQHGFYLTDGDRSWDGGFGVEGNTTWKVVQKSRVPKSVRAKMDWIFEE